MAEQRVEVYIYMPRKARVAAAPEARKRQEGFFPRALRGSLALLTP